METAEIDVRIADIEESEARLRTTVEALGDADLGHASQCEGWTRGHVLAHIALNAHSLVNLFEWARTGEERAQYASSEARTADIERFSKRSASEHLIALDEARRAFHSAATSLPLDRWSFPVRGLGGIPVPAEIYLIGRRRELEVHHVDLDAGYGPRDWPASFVRQTLEAVPDRIGADVTVAFEVEASDLGMRLQVGDGAPVDSVTGPGWELLHWLLGRGRGDGLRGRSGELPPVPSWG